MKTKHITRHLEASLMTQKAFFDIYRLPPKDAAVLILALLALEKGDIPKDLLALVKSSNQI